MTDLVGHPLWHHVTLSGEGAHGLQGRRAPLGRSIPSHVGLPPGSVGASLGGARHVMCWEAPAEVYGPGRGVVLHPSSPCAGDHAGGVACPELSASGRQAALNSSATAPPSGCELSPGQLGVVSMCPLLAGEAGSCGHDTWACDRWECEALTRPARPISRLISWDMATAHSVHTLLVPPEGLVAV